MSFIEMKNIRKDFGKLTILHGVDMTLEKGEVISIIGPSGAGKSTLLRCLNHLETIQGGSIAVDGEFLAEDKDGKVTYASEDRTKAILAKMGMVFQSFNLFPHMTVLENVMYPMTLRGISAHKAKETAKEKLAAVGLDETYYKRLPDMLSGGEQQRVAIARALASDAKVLLADEPTGNLDTENGKNIIDILKTLAREQGYCVIVVTHDLGIAAEADEVLHLSDGMVKAE